MNKILAAIIITCLFTSVYGQEESLKEGLIIFFEEGVSPYEQAYELNSRFGKDNCTCLSERFRIHLVDGTFTNADIDAAISSPKIKSALLDAPLEWRRTPNDPEVPNQNYLELINAFEAWDKTISSTTANGDEAVFAIFEEGVNFGNADLDTADLYFNPLEIPDNDIDDDQNGYVDDYYGYNSRTGDDDHYSDEGENDHGNAVTGVIGAKTDNSIEVAGLIWENPKFLIVTGRQVSDFLINVEYIINQRKLYNETNGEQGAFVVAYNMSFGSETRFELDKFCPIFDSMGVVGIIPVGATNNARRDYDLDPDHINFAQDYPTNCPSDYLIIVSNSTEDDILAPRAAYGIKSVDLAAPGENITVLNQDSVQVEDGTSFATPQVVAAVGLVYSVLGEDVLAFGERQPEWLALKVRETILNNVRKMNLLSEQLVTGGILDLNAAVEAAMLITNVSGTENETPIDVVNDGQSLQFFNLNFDSNRVASQIQIHDMLGRQLRHVSTEADDFQLDITDLSSGAYIYSVSSSARRQKVGRFLVQ